MDVSENPRKTWRQKLFTVIFEADTRAGKTFDIVLLIFIVLSILLVMVESIPGLQSAYGALFYKAEWGITILFTIEYVLRLLSVKKPIRYVTSFYGVIDLLSILPTYFSLFFPNAGFLLVIRSLRLMRIFRIFKLTRFLSESMGIVLALKASARRIMVFLSFVVLLSIILGAVTYVVENPYNEKFSSIPQSIYWAVVTITTVGYGDVSPVTAIGKLVASIIMLLGYAIIAVPTGIVTVELSKNSDKDMPHSQACPACSFGSHDPDASFCKKCGHSLERD